MQKIFCSITLYAEHLYIVSLDFAKIYKVSPQSFTFNKKSATLPGTKQRFICFVGKTTSKGQNFHGNRDTTAFFGFLYGNSINFAGKRLNSPGICQIPRETHEFPGNLTNSPGNGRIPREFDKFSGNLCVSARN